MFSRSYFSYWGKAKPQDCGGAQFHLLPYHCLDVAAVGLQYLRRAPAFRGFLGSRMHVYDELAQEQWIAFWLAMHDLGKFSESFQSQRPDLFKKLRGRLPDASKVYTLRHDSLGMLFWNDKLERYAVENRWFGLSTKACVHGLNYWVSAVTGHHGQPPEPQPCGRWKNHFHWQDDPLAIFQFTDDLRELIFEGREASTPTTLEPEAFERASQELSWWIAGLAVLADWLGSNTDYFAYRADPDDPLPLREYWAHAKEQAKVALDHSGVLLLHGGGALPFQSLFPKITTPSPLQSWAATTELSSGPQIYLLEDVTGAGKTEAAIFLAHRLMATGQADGFFIGLPTMATANAMYGRIARVYARLFAGNASLVLAHGQRNLVEAFAESVIPSGPTADDDQQVDESASIRCNAWLADHNKRALMAPAGVGTIDQALLAVLHSKHQSLRLLGLFRKVLVVDEVHACDAYMQGILENLLVFHAAAGGSAILLSATLPQRMKQALLRAFAAGCQSGAPVLASQSAFPLVTSWHSARPDDTEETPIATRKDVQRTVAVNYLTEESSVEAVIDAALAAGQCVCWMRNTVADALDAFALFRGKVPAEKLILFHARFALRDRLRIEGRILDLFGQGSTASLRQGQLVIATQVVEQSLDADWDVVVSDLAPIDRLIQRAGRLQRHVRDRHGERLQDPEARDQRGEPRLYVFGPQWTDRPPADWFKTTFRKAANVYAHHGRLWLTAKALQAGRFAMPADARNLIEGVFGGDSEIPEALEHNANQAEGKSYGDASEAQQNTVKLVSGYVRGGIDWWSEAKTPSRLGEASINVVLARWDLERLVPWCEHENIRHAWAYSTVRVAERLIAKCAEPEGAARKVALEQALPTLPGGGKWMVLLPLEEVDGVFVGQAWGKQSGPEEFVLRRWRYQAASGLVEVQAPDDTSSGADPATAGNIARRSSGEDT